MMHNAMDWPESRALRILLLAPIVIVAWFALTLFASSSSASAAEAPDSGGSGGLLGGVGSVLDSATGLVDGLVDNTADTVTGITKSAEKVVATVVSPPAAKPVTAILKTVVDVVPVTTGHLTTTVGGVLEGADDTLTAVTDDLLPGALDTVSELVDGTVDAVVPGIRPNVLAPVAGDAAPGLASSTPERSTASTAATAALVGSVEPTHTPAPLRFATPGTAGSAAAGGTASTPLAALPGSAITGPAGFACSATPENDVLPSSPVFDTDVSPD